MAADVTDGLEAATVQGAPVLFSIVDGVVKINDVNIVATDIVASNGVIHVIDAVIMPPTQ
jgi:transforming growth factor-beta-induced protein